MGSQSAPLTLGTRGGGRCARCGDGRSASCFDSLNGPLCMLRDERLGIGRRRLQRGQILRGADIAEGDADIPQEPAPFDPFDRRLAEELAEALVVQGEEPPQCPSVDEFTGGEAAFL